MSILTLNVITFSRKISGTFTYCYLYLSNRCEYPKPPHWQHLLSREVQLQLSIYLKGLTDQTCMFIQDTLSHHLSWPSRTWAADDALCFLISANANFEILEHHASCVLQHKYVMHYMAICRWIMSHILSILFWIVNLRRIIFISLTSFIPATLWKV